MKKLNKEIEKAERFMSYVSKQKSIKWKGYSTEEWMVLFMKKDREDLKEKLKEELEEAQEDYANLDWISKEQAIKIIDKIFSDWGKNNEI
jgi:hypothetical protein